MTEAIQKEQRASWLSGVVSALRDPAVQLRNVDRLAVLIAILLPWSTTGVGIAVALWLMALVPTLEQRALWRSLARPASALPLLLVALALVGTL
jgi:O-antigen ligase